MKSRILRACIIFFCMILLFGINKAYTQTINSAPYYPDIRKTAPNYLVPDDSGALGRFREFPADKRYRALSEDENWELEIKGTGQSDDVSIIKIGIDPNGEAYPPPPFNPPDFSVVLTIKQGTEEFTEDVRPPGAEQEVWILSVFIGGSNVGGSAEADDPGFFPVLTWDPNEIGPATVMDLRLGDANGPVILDMETNNTYQTMEADAIEYVPSFDYALIEYAVVFEPAPLYTYYRDTDGDGYGDPNDTVVAETPPDGYAVESIDCDYNDPNTYPGAPEICDGKDNSCNSMVDFEIMDPNNLNLEIEDLGGGLNRILIDTPCASYSSYDFLLNFKGLLDIASLNLDKRDVTGSFLSTYYFFGKISGNGFELSQDTLRPNLLYIY
ncbi:MAG: putative metal-binding motif-containing protein [bacterium]